MKLTQEKILLERHHRALGVIGRALVYIGLGLFVGAVWSMVLA